MNVHLRMHYAQRGTILPQECVYSDILILCTNQRLQQQLLHTSTGSSVKPSVVPLTADTYNRARSSTKQAPAGNGMHFERAISQPT